jgi:hypothetical protein
MTVDVELNLNIDKVTKEVIEANREAMRDTVVSITNDAVKLSPWLTGHNRRSISGEVSGMGMVASGGEGEAERMVDDSKIEGAVYSTSGYGGFLETGTYKMPGRPYFKPSLDMNFTQEKYAERVKRHLK